MIVNLSLILLSYQSTNLSPIITSYGSTFTPSFKYEKINIFKVFNSFYFQTYGKMNNKILVSNSLFTHTLNPVFFLSSESDQFYSTQIHVINEGSAPNNPFTVTNCCFSQCLATDPSYINGTAIYTVLDYAQITAISTVFVKCSASGYGGCIYSTGQKFDTESSIFADNQCDKSGSAIFFQKSVWSPTTINQTLFINNICEGSTVYADISDNHCTNTNFTRNKNINKGQLSIQKVSSVYFFWNQFNMNFDFIWNNIVQNQCDVLVDMKLCQYINGRPYEFVNIIGNTNIIFFFFYNDINPSDKPFLYHFAFFGNEPLSPSDGIKMANAATVSYMIFADCVFEYEEAVVNSMLNGHKCETGSFGQTKTTFQQSWVFIQPTKCDVDLEYITKSKEFSKSSIFSETTEFSNSKIFTNSIIFSFSSQFSRSLHFSNSNLFLSFSKITSSSPFSKSSLFSSTYSFSASSVLLLSATKEFTPSFSFTPSNFFTPNRTKMPDPAAYNQADVKGRNKDVFSKEELKKAAAPMSISLVIIIVSIVLCIIYIRRRMKTVMNQDNVPEFDTSFESDNSNDSGYSYSYYTYSYYYAEDESDDTSYDDTNFDVFFI